MHPNALRHAWENFHIAEQSVNRMNHAAHYEDAAREWRAFLLAATTVFNKLHAGSKGSPKSEGWYSKYRGERSSDPLLAYLMQARHATEHGVAEVTEVQPGFFAVHGDVHIHHLSIGPDGIRGHIEGINPSRPARIEHKVTSMGLIPVQSERDQKQYDIPRFHRGAAINPIDPRNVAALGLSYLRSMLQEAGKL